MEPLFSPGIPGQAHRIAIEIDEILRRNDGSVTRTILINALANSLVDHIHACVLDHLPEQPPQHIRDASCVAISHAFVCGLGEHCAKLIDEMMTDPLAFVQRHSAKQLKPITTTK